MKLELDILNIKDVQFAEKTTTSDRVLYINRQELQELLEKDKRLSKVYIELSHPRKNYRILQVDDVIEPWAKTVGSGEDFTPVLDKQVTVEEGSTCVLRSVAVVINNQSGVHDLPDVVKPMGKIIDMSGPGAEFSLYEKTQNVVVLPYPVD